MMKTKDKNQMVQDVKVIWGLSPEAFAVFKAKPQYLEYLKKEGKSIQVEDPLSIGSQAGQLVTVYSPGTRREAREEREFFDGAGQMGDVLSREATAAEGKKKELLEAYAKRLKAVSEGNRNPVTSIAEESRDLISAFRINRQNVMPVLENGITLGDGRVLHPFDLMIHGERLKGTMEAYQTAKKEGSLDRQSEIRLRKEMKEALKGIGEELKHWQGLDLSKLSEEDKAKFSKAFLKPENSKEFFKGITTLTTHTRAYETALQRGWPISDLNAFTTIFEASFQEKDPVRKKAFTEMRDKMMKVNYYKEEDPDAVRSALFMEIEQDLTKAGAAADNRPGPNRLGIVQMASGSPWNLMEKENVQGVQRGLKRRNAPQNNAEEEKPEEEMTDEELEREIQAGDDQQREDELALQELMDGNGGKAELPADDNAVEQLEQEIEEEQPGREDPRNELFRLEEDPEIEEDLQNLEDQVNREDQANRERQEAQDRINDREDREEEQEVQEDDGPEEDAVILDDVVFGEHKDYSAQDKKVLEDYQKALINNEMSVPGVEQARGDWAEEAMRRAAEIENPADLRQRQLLIQVSALGQGWSIMDMDALDAFVESVETAPAEARREGRELLNGILNVPVNTEMVRQDLLSRMAEYVTERYLNADERGRDVQNTYGSRIRQAQNRTVQWCEFPEDPVLVEQAMRDGKLGRNEFWEKDPKSLNQEKDKTVRRQLRAYAIQNRRLEEADQKNIREKNNYVLPSMNQEELEKWHKNIARKKSHIEIGSRKAAILTMGPDLYEEADRKYQGSLEERTVPIHHAMGTRYNNAGSHVLEIDIGGSGFIAPTHDHHGISAWDGIFDSNLGNGKGKESEAMLTEEYGERANIRGHEDKTDIRWKSSETTLPNGKKVKKDRYAIPGPIVLGGSVNAGKYSIDNTRQVVSRIGEDFLTPIFERWESGQEVPEDIHINISGHSRGGCGAGEGTDLLREWLSNHERFNKYADRVKIDLIQLDAVPGYGDRRAHGKLNYRSEQPADKKQPAINGTAIYSMSTEWPDAMFRPQEIQGADRVIFGMTPHAAGLNIVDRSQMAIDKDGKAHRRGFYDLETGEFYRGSGIAELPEGVYFSDDKQNLVRITAFSQLNGIMDMVCIGADRQMERQNVLRSVVRNWFATHELTDTYRNPDERDRVQDQMKRSADKLMKGTDSEYGLGAVRERLRALSEAREGNNADKIKEAEDALIRDCRSYMAKVPITATHTERKDLKNMDLVGDILSGVQRERNFREKNQTYTRSNEPATKEVKDQRIKTDADKANLIRNSVKLQAKDFLRRLEEQDKKYKPGKKNSPEYLRMRAALKECAELDGKNSVREVMDAVSELSTATKHYQDVRGGFFRLAGIGGGLLNMARYAFSPSTRQRLSFANDLQKTADGFLKGMVEDAVKVYDKSGSLQQLIARKDPKLAYEQDSIEKMDQLRRDFEESALKNKLDPVKVEENKQLYRTALNDLSKTVPEDSAAGMSYSLQQSALQKGWGISDLRMMDTLANTVYDLRQDPEAAQKGRELIGKIRETQVNGRNDRTSLMADIMNYADAIKAKHPDFANVLSDHIEDSVKRKLYWAEYPKDVVLLAQAQKNGELDVIRDGGMWIKEIAKDPALGEDLAKKREYLRDHLQEMADRHLSSPVEKRRAVRDKDTYVMPQQSREEQDRFVKNTAQRATGISVSNRQAAKCVFGDAEYDQIDRLRAAENADERTVQIHHAKGNRYMNEGSHVLEINVGGSGSYLRELDYHGQTGRNTDRDWEESIRLQYGDRVSVPGLEGVHSIRRKSEQRLVNGEMIQRERYMIPGPTVLGIGLLDKGKYQIGESRKMIQQIGENFLTPIFEEWKKKQAEDPEFVPKDVHVRLSGYSRGAVATGFGKEDLMNWVKNHPEYKGFAKYVKPESVLFDPVPGPDGYAKGFGENNLSGGNDTIIYMMANEHNAFFKPQDVKGAGKYILGITTHASGQDFIDLSQKGVDGDGKAHKQGYYDVESGEYYRGGGIADLSDGVYFADESQNLHRLSSFSQLNKLYDLIGSDGGAKDQKDRAGVIKEALKEYFADHDLGISYTSEYEKDLMDQKRQRIGEQILREEAGGKKTAGDLSAVQAALQQVKNAGPDPQNAGELRQNLLDACKEYMKRTPVTENADDRRRMDQVSDLCSLLKREICFEEKGYQPRKNRTGLDEVSIAERMDSAQRRQEKINGVLTVLTEGGAQSGKLLDKLDATVKKGSDSEEYTRMRAAVVKCAKLDDNASIVEIRDAYEEMHKAARDYVKEKKTGLFKTDSEEGKKRIEAAEEIMAKAEEYRNMLEQKADGLSEQFDSIWEVKERNRVKIREMQAYQPVIEKQPEPIPVKQEEKQPEAKPEIKQEQKPEPQPEQRAEEPKPKEEKKAAAFEIGHGGSVEYQGVRKEQIVPDKPVEPLSIGNENSITINGQKETASSQRNDPKPQNEPERKAVNVGGWGSNHFYYESKPGVSGQRKKTSLNALEETGKKERVDYSKLREEKNEVQLQLKGKDAAQNTSPAHKK